MYPGRGQMPGARCARGVGKKAVAVADKDVGHGREQDAEALSNGHVRYELKTPHRDGTTHVIFEPLDFIAFSHEDDVFILPGETRLVALVPKPRVNILVRRLRPRTAR